MIEIKESKEGVKFVEGGGSFPLLYTVDLDRIHGNAIFADDDAEVLDFRNFKLTFLRFEVQVIVGQYLENVVHNLTV